MKRAIALVFAALFVGFCAPSVADTPPGPVSDLKATPFEGQVKLEWCKPKGIEGVLSYEIYKKTQDKVLVEADIVPANRVGIFGSDGGCLMFIDSAVKGGNSYSYAVIVVNGTGARSTLSRGAEDANTVATMP